MAKALPSGSGLPVCWNKEMDRFICQCDAIGNIDTRSTILALKKKYPLLAEVSRKPPALKPECDADAGSSCIGACVWAKLIDLAMLFEIGDYDW